MRLCISDYKTTATPFSGEMVLQFGSVAISQDGSYTFSGAKDSESKTFSNGQTEECYAVKVVAMDLEESSTYADTGTETKLTSSDIFQTDSLLPPEVYFFRPPEHMKFTCSGEIKDYIIRTLREQGHVVRVEGEN